MVIVFSAKETKDYAQMIGQLKMLTPHIFFPKLTLPNMVGADTLHRAYPRGRVMPDLKTALKHATLKAGKDGTVVITGSLYLAGEVLKQVRSKK
jgi:folylpolyglutamate synthase/dihydropteroate synthase